MDALRGQCIVADASGCDRSALHDPLNAAGVMTTVGIACMACMSVHLSACLKCIRWGLFATAFKHAWHIQYYRWCSKYRFDVINKCTQDAVGTPCHVFTPTGQM